MACAKLVESLTWTDVAAGTGPTVRAAAQLAKQAYGRYMIDEPPARLKVGPFRVMQMRSNAAVITTYSGFDPIELPVGLLQLLPLFDGRRVDQVVEEIQQQYDVEIDSGLIRRLIDFEVLIPA